MSAKPENERERIARIIEEKVSGPILRDPLLRAAHRADIEAAADAIIVGEAGSMPGTDGFTMAVFKATDVPIGTKLYATPPASQALRQVDPDIIGDVSSLIAARCSALPGKLIDCPVCGAVDAERGLSAEAQARVDVGDLPATIDAILQQAVKEDDYPKGAHRFFQEDDPYGDRENAVTKIVEAILAEEARPALLSGSTPKPARVALTGEPAKAIAKVERYLDAREFMGVETPFIDDQATGSSDGDPVVDLWAGDLRTIVDALKSALTTSPSNAGEAG